MADEKTRDASLQSNTPQTKSLDTEDRTDGLRRPAELKIGQLVSERYTIKASLGRGGIGSVYRVHQILLDKEFALKTLNPVTASSATMRRFHLEAQSAGKLNHPNIVKAFDFGLIDGVQPFLVMDVIEGKTLSRILKQGKLPLNIFLEIFIPLTQAIAYAHSEGVVHRDLKPSNIVLEPDKENAGKYIPKLIDFGLAKLTDSDSLSQHQTLTKAGDVIGTPLYMSPEQCSGTSVDHRSDIYSLGCVMFEALTGKPPFRADTAIETLMQHGTKRPPLLNETCEGIEFPPELEELIDTLLAKDPAERFESCTLVADQLIAIKSSTNDETNEEEIAIAIARLADEPSTNPASLRQISILLFLGAVLALAAAIFVVNSSRTTPDTAQGAAVQHAMLPTEQAGPLSADRLTAPPDDGKAIVPWAKLEGANRVFHFPKNRRLGKLGWKVGTGYELALATGLVRLPQDTKIIFMCSEMMLRSPTDVGGFGTDDFRGVNVKLGEILTGEEVVEKSMSSLLASKNLTLVTITDGSLSADNLSKLGSLPKLTWLTLIGNEAKLEELAALKNLDNLRLLRIEGQPSVSPVIEKLSKSRAMERLELNQCGLTLADVKAISEIRNLKVLSVKGNFGKNPDTTMASLILRTLSTLPNLEVLGVDHYLVEDPTNISLLSKCKNLKYLYIKDERGKPIDRAWVKKYLPKKCAVIHDVNKTINLDWFDPLATGKHASHLW